MSADEMGPIAVAAMWNGQDWSELMEHCVYYSYGYAILLYPLFAFFKGPVAFYRAAIVLNAILVACVIPLAVSVGKKVFSNVDIRIVYLGAFVAANCGGNISRSPSAWCEVLLMFLNWLLLWVFTITIEKISYKKIIAAAIAVVYLYTVHQRMLGVVVAYSMSLAIYCFMRKKSIKYYAIYLMTLFVALAGHRWIKSVVKLSLWRGGATSNTNDYSSTINHVFSQNISDFLKNFVYSLSGHLFYIIVATAGLALIAITVLSVQNTEYLVRIIRKQEIKERHAVVDIYVLLAFWGILGISLLYLCKAAGVSTSRSDYLLYGRYVEPILSVLIFWGIMMLNNNRTSRKVNKVLGVSIALFSCLSYRRYIVIQDLPFNKMNCVGLNIFYKDGRVHYLSAILMVIFVLAILLLSRKRYFKNVMIGLVALYGIISGILFVKENVIPTQNIKYELVELIDEKERLNDNARFYYFGSEGAYIYNSSFIQYLLKDEEILYYESELQIPDGVFYGVTEDINFVLEHDELTILDMKDNIILFTNETENECKGLKIPIDEFGFSIDRSEETQSNISSNGYEGIFMYGPYISLDEGSYRVTISYEASAVEEEWGKAEIYHLGTNQMLDEVTIDNTIDQDGNIILEFELKEPMDSLEFRIHTVDGQEVVVGDVVLQQLP